MKYAILPLLSLLLLAACKTAPIHQYDSIPIAYSDRVSLTGAEVKTAILHGAEDSGWQAAPLDLGVIEATYTLRNHEAAVEITYTPTTYPIHYKDSQVLNYDGTSIHRAYNTWVDELRLAIDKRLASAHYK